MRLESAITDYLFSKYDLSPATRRWYEEKLRAFAAWASESANADDLEQVTSQLIRQYLASLWGSDSQYTHKPLSTYTVHGYAQVIKGFFSWCASEDLASEQIAKRVRLPRVEIKVIEVFTPAQIKQLYAACATEMTPALAARDKAVLSVLLDTGIRATELCGLTLDDLHLSIADSYLQVFGKGRKHREVGLGNTARLDVHRYLYRHRQAPPDERHAFVGRYQQPLTSSGLLQVIERLGMWAGIEGVRCSPHTFRHTYAVRYIAAGGDVYALSRLLGHTSVSVTENYLRAFRSKDARRGLSVLDNLK